MSAASQYWQLMQLKGSGGCHIVEQASAKTWLQTRFFRSNALSDENERALQKQLWQIWQQATAEAELALLCLRCYVSHHIHNVCLQLARQFGATYGFTVEDLLPFVLDDQGQAVGAYQPFALQILESYDLNKAGLATWTVRRVKHHPDLDQFLQTHGLYRVSDWAILNDTTPEQLQRVLAEFHYRTESEIQQATELLRRYHAVYRSDRLHQLRTRRGNRCYPPTQEQLERIDATVSASAVLAQLHEMASLLRQYRIHVRSRYLQTVSLEAAHFAEPLAAKADENEAVQAEFLSQYRQMLDACLDEAIAQAVQVELARLKRKQPPQDQAFLTALRLFLCQGMRMSAIAPQIGYKTQVQVTRLMRMKAFRTNVRHYWLTQLRQRTLALAQAYLEPDQLHAFDQALDQLLAEQIDEVIERSQAEAQKPQRTTPTNRFDQRVCHYLSHHG
ncbi:MAG: hypothetical protein ACTS3T_19310 [Almyronema sp.]